MDLETNKILNDISVLTLKIQEDYPELQKYLDEQRSTLPHDDLIGSTLDLDALQSYRDGLKELIDHYKENHMH